MVEIKTDAALDAMREAGRVVARVLAAVRKAAAVGVRPTDLDETARTVLRVDFGAELDGWTADAAVSSGGRDHYRTDLDGWTLRTADGSRAAHMEHTVAITDDGPRVLTLL